MENETKMTELFKDVWDSLTDEQKKKAAECKNADELLAFAGSEGIELPDELVDAVSGGALVQITDKYGCTTWNVYHKGVHYKSFKWDEFDKAKEYADKKKFSTEVKSLEEAEKESCL